MTQAITTTPGVRGGVPCVAGTRMTVAYFLELVAANGIDKVNCSYDFPAGHPMNVMIEIINHYSQPPGPSIEAAAEELSDLAFATDSSPEWLPAFRDILTRHFGQASRAERAWELLEGTDWQCEKRTTGLWLVRSKGKELARADNPITAILAAAEKGKDDG